MPYADYSKQLAWARKWSKTTAGRVAKQRSHQRYIDKRRASQPKTLTANPAPLAQALNHWRTQ